MFHDHKKVLFSYEEKKRLLEARYLGIPTLFASAESNVHNDPISSAGISWTTGVFLLIILKG